MSSKGEIEMRWVDLWNEVYDLIEQRSDFPCVLPDGSVVAVKTCLGSLQEMVYAGRRPTVSRGWHLGRPAVVVSDQAD